MKEIQYIFKKFGVKILKGLTNPLKSAKYERNVGRRLEIALRLQIILMDAVLAPV